MASCGLQEPASGPQPDGECTTISAALATVQSKTWLHYASLKVYWSDGDRINVNGQTSFPIAVPEGKRDSVAKFLLPKQDPPYRVVYPAEVVTEYTSDGTVTVELPQTQAYNPTSFASGAALMCAYAESLEEVTLQNLCAAIRVNITGTEGAIESAELISLSGNAPLCGTFCLSPEEGKLTPVNGKNELSLHMETPVSVSKDGTDFFFVIPPGNYSEGLVFNFVNTDKVYMQNIWEPKDALCAGELYSFNATPYDAKFKAIETAEEWNEFAADINAEKGDASRFVFKDGVVRLGADINDDEVELKSITKNFKYIFDGNGKTIKRNNATSSLFSDLTGEIRNLTLDGKLSLTGDGAPFVTSLNPGAKITRCINKMNVAFEFSDAETYVAGFAAVLPTTKVEGEYVTMLTECVNYGNLIGETSYSQELEKPKNVAIGGIIGDVRAGGETDGVVYYSVVLKKCSNNGAITFTPVPSDLSSVAGANLKPSMGLTGIGGIAGTLRASKSIEFDDCDNAGNITLSAEDIKNKYGMRPYAIAMGGVVGCGTGTSGLGLTLTGHDITLKNCDNSGTLYNCGDNYSPTGRGHNKIFTGGLAGALVGLESQYASLQSCSNKGTILTYDICSDDKPEPTVVSVRPCYNAVAGGLIGFGGWLDMEDCTVSCQIGNGKRQMVAWGGMIGYTVKPFKLKDATLHLSGYFQRIETYKMNRAVVAVVPAATKDDGLTPDVSGSVISGTIEASSTVKSSGTLATASTYTNLSSTLTTTMFGNNTNVRSNLVHGQGMTTSNTGVEVTATITYK